MPDLAHPEPSLSAALYDAFRFEAILRMARNGDPHTMADGTVVDLPKAEALAREADERLVRRIRQMLREEIERPESGHWGDR